MAKHYKKKVEISKGNRYKKDDNGFFRLKYSARPVKQTKTDISEDDQNSQVSEVIYIGRRFAPTDDEQVSSVSYVGKRFSTDSTATDTSNITPIEEGRRFAKSDDIDEKQNVADNIESIGKRFAPDNDNETYQRQTESKAETFKPQSDTDAEIKQKYSHPATAKENAVRRWINGFLQKREAASLEKKARKLEKWTADKLPSTQQLEAELKRERNKKSNNKLLRNSIFALVTVAASTVLVATLFLPVLQIYGSSMTPTLSEGDVVVSVKGSDFKQGDIISFYYNNKILVKRVIAFEGDWINIDKDGTVYVNNRVIDEPYVSEHAFGECDLELPYQVPAGRLFVCGDHRATSIDSRSSSLGCVAEEQIVGKIVFRIWPFNEIGEVK